MLLAPILAVALVLSIAAAVSYLPAGPQASTNNGNSLEPSPKQYFNVTPYNPSSAGSYNIQTPAPTSIASATTPPPTAIPMSGNSSTNLLPFAATAAAVIIGIITALTLLSERNLKKELARD